MIETDARVARGVAALYLAGVITLGLNTIFLVLLTNSSSQVVVGLVSFLNVILVSASTISVLALPLHGSGVAATPPAVTRFLSRSPVRGRGTGKGVYLLSLVLCGIISLVIVVSSAYPPLASLVAGPSQAGAVLFACVDAMVYSFGQLGAYAMLGTDRATTAGKMIMVTSGLRYLFASVFLLAGAGPAGIFIGFALGDSFLALGANFSAFRDLRQNLPSSAGTKPVLKYMVSVFFAALVGLAVTQSDKLLAFLKLGLPPLAVYNIAIVGAAVASFVPSAVTNVIVPSLAASGGQESQKREFLRAYTRHVSLSAVPIGFVLAAVSPFLLRVFGDAYTQGAPVMALIAISISFTAISAVYSSILLVDDRAHHFTISNVLGLVGLVAIALVTVPTYGFVGIAVGRAAMLFIILGATAYFVWKSGRLVLDYMAYIKSVAASALGGIIVFFVLNFANQLGLGRAAIVGASLLMIPLGFAIYLLIMKAVKAYTEEDMDFIETLIPVRLRIFSRIARKLL